MTYISWSSDFALYLEDYLIYQHHTLGLESVWPDVWPQNKCKSLWPIFHGPVILPYILKTIWYMNTILWNYESVWPDVWPKNKCRSLWPIFHCPLIIPYIFVFDGWMSYFWKMSQCNTILYFVFFLIFALKNILVLLAKHDSGELRCPATALICSNRIRTLVSMATYSCHWLIMGKVEIGICCYLTADILTKS